MAQIITEAGRISARFSETGINNRGFSLIIGNDLNSAVGEAAHKAIRNTNNGVKGLCVNKEMRLAGFSIFIKHIFSHELQTHDNHSTFLFLFNSPKKTN